MMTKGLECNRGGVGQFVATKAVGAGVGAGTKEGPSASESPKSCRSKISGHWNIIVSDSVTKNVCSHLLIHLVAIHR